MTHEFLAVYPAKLLEYSLAVGYLLCFVGFWKYVQGGRPAEARAEVHEPVRQGVSEWFTIPEGFYLHPGHSWARVSPDGLVTVGIDDFAHKLVGPARVELPRAGAPVAQGEPAFALRADTRAVDMLSPVDGTVVEVNRALSDDPEKLTDTYGAGWLFRVNPPRFAANAKQLLQGASARLWESAAGEALARRLSPELGQVLADGGTPVHGIAQELEPDRWDELARSFFLT
ncbi:MAG TPA: glycine cleavage system protein H [Anaeromyxobacteraceae bacterium]|jgi:glycine cleavage system H lipoate-binding protein|nr:glycine cleavage system protein H [Anaeromyxobacteraceae bacterium]